MLELNVNATSSGTLEGSRRQRSMNSSLLASTSKQPAVLMDG